MLNLLVSIFKSKWFLKCKVLIIVSMLILCLTIMKWIHTCEGGMSGTRTSMPSLITDVSCTLQDQTSLRATTVKNHFLKSDAQESLANSDISRSDSAPPIHFVETKKGKRHLTPREACVIESAARHHPNSIVTLYTVNGYFNWNDIHIKILKLFSNINIVPLNLTELFTGTPVLDWHMNNTINTSRYPTEHMSDAFRFVIMHKYGGIYLDTDSVVVNTLQYLKNTVALEVNRVLAVGVLIFDKEHPFMTNCVYDYAMNFRGNSWSDNGPMLATRILRKMCNVNDSFESVMNKPELCQGISVLPRKAFYSISWDDLFRAKKPIELDFSDIYVVHLWSKITRKKQAITGNHSVIENLFKIACPSVYQQVLKIKTF